LNSIWATSSLMSNLAVSPGEVSIDDKVAFLRSPETYGNRVERVEVVETHTSWVFLAGNRVYKLKKPLRLDFVDFSSVESRRQNCERSVQLNRRLAGDVYIRTVPLTRESNTRLELDGGGKVVDWLVEMRRLPINRMLDTVIGNRIATPDDIRRVTERLDLFYKEAAPVAMAPAAYVAKFAENIQENHAVLTRSEYGLPLELVLRLTETQQRFVQHHTHLLAKPARDHHIVEGHGDLRPEHVCLVDPPVIIDCLEFNWAFRVLDPVDELAYLALECERLGAPWIGNQVLQDYAKTARHSPPEALVSFYGLFRACVRAKLALWHVADPLVRGRSKWLQRAREYLEIAERKVPKTLHSGG
jgi:uncharacterized protein